MKIKKFTTIRETYENMMESAWGNVPDPNDDGLTDDQRAGVIEYPLNYAYISPLDWKYEGDAGRLSYKLYKNIRNGTVYRDEPRFYITTDESKEYMKIPVSQLKYVIKTAIEKRLDIDDSIWDLLDVKSK
jgi:hypothetical protein